MTSPMDDALHRIIDAVAQYKVPERVIAIAAECLESMPGETRHEIGLFALVDANQLVAASHGGPHPDCSTCTAIGNMLAVSMAMVRAETDLALAKLISE